MTFEEITAREADLRHEIAERKQLLGAYQLIRADRGKTATAPCDAVAGHEAKPEALPGPAAPPLASVPPVPVLSETNLAALGKGYGGGIRVATWAIRQMTGDFTVRDLAAALRQAGAPMGVSKLSVIVNRMKDEGKIAEVATGRGRTPSVFHATEHTTLIPLELAARHSKRRPTRYRISR